jgi:hypothetical protein
MSKVELEDAFDYPGMLTLLLSHSHSPDGWNCGTARNTIHVPCAVRMQRLWPPLHGSLTLHANAQLSRVVRAKSTEFAIL